MSCHTVQDFYGLPQPCVMKDCGKNNQDVRGEQIVRLFLAPDMAPVCADHYDERVPRERRT